jgi:hypothetical protein
VLVHIGREEVPSKASLIDARLKFSALQKLSRHRHDSAPGAYDVGDELGFALNYGALLSAMTSEFVEKRPLFRDMIATTVEETQKHGRSSRARAV